MSDLEFKDLVSFDELVTPRIVPFAFWATQACNAFFWIRRLWATGITDIPAGMDTTGKLVEAHTTINWSSILFCMLALLATSVLIRVGADLLLCIFRWQASTRGILMAMTGAPASLASAQAQPGATAPPAPAAARPAAVSASPPWESATPQATSSPVPAPSPAPPPPGPSQAAPQPPQPPQV